MCSAIPNALTTLRLILAPLVCYFACERMYVWATCAFWVASVSDFFDGYLARKLHCESLFGRVVDPVADKLLTLCSYIPLRAEFSYLFLLVILRDVGILSGIGVLRFLRIKITIAPSVVSKVNTGFVLLFPFVWLCQKSFGFKGDVALIWLAGIIVITTILSTIGYAVTFAKTIRNNARRR